MRVLVFHGYLLRGTGSNVYSASLADALVRLGHEVHLLSQDRHARELPFVGAVGDWDSGELAVTRVRDTSCTAYRPDIGGLLPVYVEDRYEGVETRLFQDLSDEELDAYLEANVGAVRDVVARSGADVALANHLVMGPVIMARSLAGTGIPYAVKIHGSALEYTVKANPRFVPYAREGVAGARSVLVGSRHVAESLWAALDDDSLRARTWLGPPGVDTRLFHARERSEAIAQVREVADRIAASQPARVTGGQADADPPDSAFARDDAAAAAALSELADSAASGPVVAFIGKLIVAKGIDLVLAAWPLVLAEVPSARLAIVGFGAYRTAVERWIEALSSGDLDALRAIADPLTFARAFFERRADARYLAAAGLMGERVIIAGRLEHAELAGVLPLCEAIVVPSTFPEAFGMVAVEAAACGALPISAAHSGLAEVSRALAQSLPEQARGLASFPMGAEAVDSIAERLTRWLQLPPEIRAAARAALIETAGSRYSWEGVARGVIAAGLGDSEMLTTVPC